MQMLREEVGLDGFGLGTDAAKATVLLRCARGGPGFDLNERGITARGDVVIAQVGEEDAHASPGDDLILLRVQDEEWKRPEGAEVTIGVERNDFVLGMVGEG